MEYQVVDRSAIKLPGKIDPLIASIEESLGRPVVFAMIDDHSYAEAFANVQSDGTPLIGLTSAGCREITIVHELLHLECEALGFPRTRTLGKTAKLPQNTVSHMISEWFSTVEHRVIYPKMEKLGYNPSGDIDSKARIGFLSRIQNNLGEFLYNNPNRDILFVDLVTQSTRVLTEGRRPLRKELNKTMKEVFPKELELSNHLTDQIKAVDNWTPQEVKRVAEYCLEAIGIPRDGIYIYS